MTPQIIAHRGASYLAPENTLTAFKKAMEIGADGVEMDVQQTIDAGLVIHHDYIIDSAHGYFRPDLRYDRGRTERPGFWQLEGRCPIKTKDCYSCRGPGLCKSWRAAPCIWS